MPTRRTLIARPAYQGVSQQAVDLFRFCLRLENGGLAHAEEFRDAEMQLHRELGLQPWHPFVTWVRADDEPDPRADPMKRAQFEHVVELRRALEDAIE